MRIARSFLILVALFCMMVSCTHRYALTNSLYKPLALPLTCSIGPIVDGLPVGTEMEQKPTLEEVQMLKAELRNKLAEKEIFQFPDTNARYEVQGEIIEFIRGSGGMRFLFGIFAGTARLVITLKLVDNSNGIVLFGGNFKSIMIDRFTPGDYVYRRVATGFAKALDKQIKKIEKRRKKG